MSEDTRVHVHMTVSDLEKSKAFYIRFLGVPPVKERAGYAKFLPELGPLNLALSQGLPREIAGAVDHMGVQVESTEKVREILARVKGTGLPVREEMNVNCCFANQDKFWVTDPDGVEWEVYHLNHDIESADKSFRMTGAGATAASALAEAAAEESSCCPPACCSTT